MIKILQNFFHCYYQHSFENKIEIKQSIFENQYQNQIKILLYGFLPLINDDFIQN